MPRNNGKRARSFTAALCVLLVPLGGCGGSTAAVGSSGSQARTARDPTSRAKPVVDVGNPVGAASSFNGGARTVGAFAKRGTAAGELAEPFGIAVDRRSGDVYVVDSNNERVEKFSSAGRFLLAWGWGVADGKTRALQTCRKRCFAGFRGEGAGQLQFAEGVAVDNDPSSRSRGSVYVVDIENARVQKFSPSGRFLLTFGGGVNHTARNDHDRANADVCPAKPGDVCGKGEEGSTAGQLEFAVEGSFIAVARGGTVYLGQRNRVKTFSPDGRYRSRIILAPAPNSSEGREAGGVSALAVNATGDLYVVRHGVVGVIEYAPSGEPIRTLEPGGAPAYPEGPAPSLALGPAGNLFVDVYANQVHRIDEYSASGVRIASFDKGPKSPPGIADKEDGLPGMAYDPRTSRLYVVNADVNVKPVVSRVRVIAPPRP
jgi:DNA-binding beta-propeller fold protein YncE